MRARNIKPSFFTNPDLGECSPVSRLLFAGLWCCADREGRLPDRPKQVKAQVFPYDNVNINEHLDELASFGLIERYEVCGVKVIWIPAFKKHQRPHVKEKTSELPPKPDVLQPRHEQAPTQVSAGTNLSTNEPALNPECGMMNPEYGMRNEESPNPHPLRVMCEFDIPAVLDDERFTEVWRMWKAKLKSHNARDLDPWTEKMQLDNLASRGLDDAIAIVRYCVGLTKCNNLIMDGSHKRKQAVFLGRTDAEIFGDE